MSNLSSGYPHQMTDISLNTNDINIYISDTIQRSKKNYDKILNYNFSNNNYIQFLSIIVNEDNYMKTMFNQLIFWQYVSNHEDIRKASSNAELELTNYTNEIYIDEYIYIKLLNYYQVFSTKLSILQRRFLRKFIRSFETAGASLNKEDKKKLLIIQKKLISLELLFIENIGNNNKTILLSDDQLKGLPQSKLDSLPCDNISVILTLQKENIQESTQPSVQKLDVSSELEAKKLDESKCNKRIIDFKYPTYKLCMKSIDDSNIRKLLDYEFNTLCKDVNTKILVEILILRQLKAELLGKKNHASLVQSQLIIKDPKNVNSFLNDIRPTFDMLFLEELRFLLRLKEQDCKEKNVEFNNVIDPWDISYYFSMAEKKLLGKELETINEYFSLDQVQKICFNLCRQLFGVKFVKKNNTSVWNNDIETYCAYDDKSNTKLGTLYLDLFPRKNKFNHMACFTIIPYCEYYDEDMKSTDTQLPYAAVVGNFTTSITKGPNIIPPLLTHDEVITFFHEIGHAMHEMCGRIGFARLSGTNVEQDFVETPSQILENWCWEKNVLNQFKHWKTNKFLSNKIIDKLIKKRSLNNGFHYKRLITLSEFDQVIHSYKPFLEKLKEMYSTNAENAQKLLINTFKTIYNDGYKSKKINSPKFSVQLQEGTFMPADWGHLVGYDARYYSYLWSDAFSDCMFNTRFKNNIFNKKAGLDYRTIILNTGGSVKATTMIQNFIKDKPTLEPFFQNKIYIVRGIIDNDDYTSETSTEINSINPIIMIKYEKPSVK